jgi:hypothetical protein
LLAFLKTQNITLPSLPLEDFITGKIFFANISLAFTMVSACVLIFDVVFFVLTPKFIRRNAISQNIDESDKINFEFKVIIHLILYVSIVVVHFVAQYFSEFTDVSRLYYCLILGYLIHYLSFGSSEILISRKEEKYLALTSLLVFIFHAICISIIIVLNLSFNYFIYNLWLTLLIFTLALTAKVKSINTNSKNTILDDLIKNINLMIPLILMIFVVITNFNIFLITMIIIGFFILNRKYVMSFLKRLSDFIYNGSNVEII